MNTSQKNTIYNNLVESTIGLSALTVETLKHCLEALEKEDDNKIQMTLIDLLNQCYYQNEKVIRMFKDLLNIKKYSFYK